MVAQRYYYSDSIKDFLSRSTDEKVGRLTLTSQHDINDETSQSSVAEIETLREVLAPYCERGCVYMEYNIPRMGRRVDVIVIIDGIVFVLEYKTKEQRFSRETMALRVFLIRSWKKRTYRCQWWQKMTLGGMKIQLRATKVSIMQ